MKAGPALTSAALALVLASVAMPAIAATPGGPKHTSPAHDAAVQRCTEEYEAKAAAAHAPNAPTGKVRLRTMHALAEAKKACIARAPK